MRTIRSRIGAAPDRLKTGVFAVLGLAFLALAVPAALEPMTFWTGIVLGGYLYPTHELHHLVLGAVFPVLLCGVIVQAYRPRRRVAALHTALVIWAALTLVFTVGGAFSPIQVVLLGILGAMSLAHPAGSRQIPSTSDLDGTLAAVAAITAIGALAFAAGELNAHLTASDAHVAFDHYLFMATAAVSVAILAPYAALRPVGWRYPAYTVAFLLGVVGVGSVLYPGTEQGSSLGTLGVLVVAWAAVFLAIAERERFTPPWRDA